MLTILKLQKYDIIPMKKGKALNVCLFQSRSFIVETDKNPQLTSGSLNYSVIQQIKQSANSNDKNRDFLLCVNSVWQSGHSLIATLHC